jgi:hypothetical protein
VLLRGAPQDMAAAISERILESVDFPDQGWHRASRCVRGRRGLCAVAGAGRSGQGHAQP